jgi:broad specificity phosphatase PhoE
MVGALETLYILNTFTLSPMLMYELVGLALFLIIVLYVHLQPKYFYIVRHGETKLNKAHIKQGSDGGLSENGKLQAQKIGQAFRSLRIQHIYTSPFERAKQSAETIQTEVHCRITAVALLAERKNASETIGKSTDDPEVMRIEGLTKYGFHEDTYRFSDEENFHDLKKRARKTLFYLSSRPHTRMLVVTHHVFLHTFLSYLLYRDDLTANDLVKLSFFNPADNGSVTLCVYHPWHGRFKETGGWEVRVYNQDVS